MNDGALRDILLDQYGLTDDRSGRAFYTLLSVSIVLGYLLVKKLEIIVIPLLNIEIDGEFAQIFGPLGLVLVFMNYHYLSAYSCISLGRFVKTAIGTGGSFADLSDQELKILVKRRGLPAKMNPYSMSWFYKIPFHISVPKPLWMLSETFWMMCIVSFSLAPVLLYAYATYSLQEIKLPPDIKWSLIGGYVFLGLGLIGTPIFWAIRVRGSRFRLTE